MLCRKPYFWTGLFVRLAAAPFLLQWFHPDERQTLEFAHFHAHGNLLPFLEFELHLRNQTVPWGFSWLVRGLDSVGLAAPWAYLTTFHVLLGVWTWLGLCALVEYVREESGDEKTGDRLGWFFALFWGFPFLYSRMLLEAISLPAVCFLLLALRRKKFLPAGIWAGGAAFLRYPGLLWAAGAALFSVYRALRTKSRREIPWAAALGVLGFAVALALGGLADWATYGSFLESLPAYFRFNRPHGPVEQMFGSDSLVVYWRWFSFLFTPWLAPLVLLLGFLALLRRLELALFCLPYVLGHLLTPHREPRFMLPIVPFLAAALALEGRPLLAPVVRGLSASRRLKALAYAVIGLHVALNFLWYPLNGWAQWHSALGTTVRNFTRIKQAELPLLTLSDPLIDALVPAGINWADQKCEWKRPWSGPGAGASAAAASSALVLSSSPPSGCAPWARSPNESAGRKTLERLLRVRIATLWLCPASALRSICPQGIRGGSNGGMSPAPSS